MKRARHAWLLPAAALLLAATGAAQGTHEPGPAGATPAVPSDAARARAALGSPGTRDADAILAELASLADAPADAEAPGEAGRTSPGPAPRRAVDERRAALALELFAVQPSHPQLVTLMPQRWITLLPERAAAPEAEIDAILRTRPSPELVEEAWYWRIHLAAATGGAEAVECAVAAYRRQYPDSPKGPRMLLVLAGRAREERQPARALALYRELLASYPGFEEARCVAGAMRQIEQRGEPFALAFQDVATGRCVEVSALRGRYVVIHFWSAGDPACGAELDRLRELRRSLSPADVAFVGIDLDGGGGAEELADLQAQIAAHGLDWPQCDEGTLGENSFALAWGIDAVPAAFVLDRNGRLVDTRVQGRLERVLTELLDVDRRAKRPP